MPAWMPGIFVTFDDEEIGLRRDRGERIDPLRVAGIGEHLLSIGYAKRGRGRAGEMHNFDGAHRVTQKLARASRFKLHHLPGKPPFIETRQGKEHFQQLVEPQPRPRRARDQERSLAPGKKLSIEQQEWKPTEMVAMQVRKQDAVDAIDVDRARLERDQGGGAEIDQQRAFGRFQEEAGVEPASRAERIPASDNSQAHGSGRRTRTRRNLGVPALEMLELVRYREL